MLQIFKQITDYDYMKKIFTLLPANIHLIEKDLYHMPEIGYLNFCLNYGVLYTFGILYMFLNKLPSWRIFILLTLIHYSLILYPIMIYVMIKFQREHNRI